jgi:hypothetical protein
MVLIEEAKSRGLLADGLEDALDGSFKSHGGLPAPFRLPPQ